MVFNNLIIRNLFDTFGKAFQTLKIFVKVLYKCNHKSQA
jgi:hypothetical protein